ncbi:hypothetical protein RB195_018776 [Necator americanus]|uniref:Uncharacterized protein n=1 Tax=Necator americanus TaxID=51031 RepID=A0ABR1CDH4_NECAM
MIPQWATSTRNTTCSLNTFTTARRLRVSKPPRDACLLKLLRRQHGAARATGNQELTSELARLWREAIKEDLKERRAEILAEAAEVGKSSRYARRDFASRKTRTTALRNPKGTIIASRREMEKITYDFYSTLTSTSFRQPLASSPSEGRRTCHSKGSSVRNTTCYLVDKKSYGTRSGQNKTRTPEEPSASIHQHPGEALYTLSVGIQGS